MKSIRVGIIGVGNIGYAHCSCIKNAKIKGMTLGALCDVDGEKRRRLAAEFPDIKVFENGDELIKSGLVDAVIVATPHYFHPHYVISALKNGVHVLSEKPAGVNVSEVLKMNEAASKSDRIFGIMFNQRTDPLFQKAKEIISDGGIGAPKRLVWIVTNWYRTQSYYDSGSWRATWNGEGGGVLINQAPHNIDLWQWLFGMPSKVTAFCREGLYHNIGVEDDATIYAEYDNGASAVFITTTGEAPGTNRLEISGDRGRIILEKNELRYTKLDVPEREFCFAEKGAAATPAANEFLYKFDNPRDGHELILEDFASAVINGTPLIAPGVEGINELSITNAAFLSSWTGKPVTLPLSQEAMTCFDSLLEEKKATEKSFKNSPDFDTAKPGYIKRWSVSW
ncbi:MAG: Gfo/Idh/MocA family oxidoreductase [Clostridia bacterium]|nr:Gfo/Idh/MocA family oxidoreductase [Clostridia bacterium]